MLWCSTHSLCYVGRQCARHRPDPGLHFRSPHIAFPPSSLGSACIDGIALYKGDCPQVVFFKAKKTTAFK